MSNNSEDDFCGATGTIWRGKGKTLKNPAVFVSARNFIFGGRFIEAGSLCKQFETRDAGYTIWKDREGKTHIARD